MKTKIIRTATIVVLLVVSLILPAQAGPPGQGPPPGPPGPTDEALVSQLQQETDGKTRISYHAETGKVRFIGTSPERPIAQPAILAAGASPEVAARGFLDTYGQLFGLSDQAQELTVMRSETVDRGRSFVRFQQIYQGVPVLGGELIVQLDANEDVVSANGEVLPEPKGNVVPTIGTETAQQRALAMVAKNHGLNADDLTTTEPELWIYNPILLGGPGLRLTTLVWRMDVEPRELLPIRELVLVDAHRGVIALHFNQIDAARNRLTYDAQNGSTLPGVLRRSEGQGPYGDTDVDSAHNYTGDTYDFYDNTHNRDGIDNAGMNLISSVHYFSALVCPNAFWNGSQMVYCDGFPQADDIVAHEMTHGVTSYESSLFYYMQSGAINEAFSDIWGEFVDLTNGTGTDTSGVRWEIGEDEPNFGTLRDMSDPPAYDSGLGFMPDRMTSTNYYCGESDNGGVHHNMGVGSKAAYLMVDGDTFNGYTVTGIGIDKTAKIFYEVQTNLFTSAADYQDLYDDLYQACTNLIGTSGITPANCQEVQDATDATQMNQQPTSCPATHAPICGSPTDLFFDNMENTGSGNWTHGAITGDDEWYYPQNSHPYSEWDATYATSGVYNIWGYDQPYTANYYIAMTSNVALPSGSHPYLHFNHAYAFEGFETTLYDGGVLEYCTGGSSLWNDAGPLFTHNGYDGTISSSYGNPLGGRQAFGGKSNGYFSSRLDLSSLAGQNVRFRFRIGTDSSVDALGWFIDDVRIYTCAGGISDWNILFDETHGYASSASDDYTIEDLLSDLATELTGNDATVDSLTPPAAFNYATISPYDVLALVLPQSSYSTQERADINTFVQNGGRLVIVGEWGGWTPADTARPILNQVLSSLGTGISLNDNQVHDPTSYEVHTYWPIIHQFSTDPVNQGVSQVVEYSAASLNVSSPGYATAWGDNDSYVTLTALSAVEQDDTGLLPDSLGTTYGPSQQSGEPADPTAKRATQVRGGEQPMPAEVRPQATISEGFEGGTMPPTGWTRIQSNPNETWKIATIGSPHSGSYFADVEYDPALLDQDEVLLSHTFMADSGSVALWSFGNLYWCRDTYDNCDLEVWFVNGNWGGGDDVYLGLVDGNWTSTWAWSYSTFDFSAYASGNLAHIALRYVGNDGAQIGVDDILIDYSASGSTIPVMAMADIGSGDVLVIGDVGLWRNGDSDGDGANNLSEYNNTQLAWNVFLNVGGGPEMKTIFLPIILRNY